MYATLKDLTAAYGEDLLAQLADRDGDGALEQAAVTRALEAAAREIDSHIGVRHALPLPGVPQLLRDLAVDIAIYKLANSHAVLTDEIRRRYDDALALLRRIAEGKASLGLPPVSGVEGPRPLLVEGAERLFSRKTLEDY